MKVPKNDGNTGSSYLNRAVLAQGGGVGLRDGHQVPEKETAWLCFMQPENGLMTAVVGPQLLSWNKTVQKGMMNRVG